MTMKIRMSLATVWVAAAFVGCVKNDEVLPLAEDEAVELEIKINGAMTKVAGTDDENKVHDVQIFIFDHNGMLVMVELVHHLYHHNRFVQKQSCFR